MTAYIEAPYTEIGTTRAPSFVDHDRRPGEHATYYIVADDAQGVASVASNAITLPSPEVVISGAVAQR